MLLLEMVLPFIALWLKLCSVTIPKVLKNQIKSSKNKIDKVTEQLIFSATELYLDNKLDEFPKNDGITYCVTLQDLVDDGKMYAPILDSNGNVISLEKYVLINVQNKRYNYLLADDCVKSGTDEI